jgi:hypothetical protein
MARPAFPVSQVVMCISLGTMTRMDMLVNGIPRLLRHFTRAAADGATTTVSPRLCDVLIVKLI